MKTTEKQREALRRYYAAHKEERTAYKRQHRASHYAEIRAREKASAVAQQDKRRARDTANRAAHAETIRAKERAYRATRKAERSAQNRAYRVTHAAEIAAHNRLLRATNAETINARRRAVTAAHPARYAAYLRQWRAEHSEETKVWRKAYHAAKPEIAREKRARRRARVKGVAINDLSAAQWDEIQAAYNYRCVYCPPDCWWCQHKKHALTRDHIDPLAKGGNHTVPNIVPACKKHNCQKKDGAPLCPVQPLLLTIAPALKSKRA